MADLATTAGGIAGHRAALARIPAGEMAALARASDRAGLVRLAGHLALVAAAGAAVLMLDGWARLAAQGVLGAFLVFLFAACHEAIHRTAFATGWMNDRLAQAAGFLLLLPPHAFRYFHFAHHRFTQDPARDPELAAPKPAGPGAYLLALSGWHYWTGQARAVLGAALGLALPDHVPPRGEARVRGEARAFLAGYAAVAVVSVVAGSTLALDLWAVPVLLGQPLLRAYLMAEHTGLPFGNDMLRNTRTTYTARALAWLAWEGNVHTAHHAAPAVPFHRLADLTRRLGPAGIAHSDGYPAAHREILSRLGQGG